MISTLKRSNLSEDSTFPPRSNLFKIVLNRPLLYIIPALQYTTPANRCIVLPSQTRTCVSGAVNE